MAKETYKVKKIGPATLVLQDALEGMKALPDNSFDLAIADPPYGASSVKEWRLPENHQLAGFGGAWQLANHEWDMLAGLEGFRFIIAWLSELKRIVKPTGSIWIHSTYHNSGMTNVACQLLGIEIINEVIWFKRNAFPNLACKRLTASHETILWAHTGNGTRKYRFNYAEAKAAAFPGDNINLPGKQLRTVWDISNNKEPEELEFGKHPTQKPLRLLRRQLLVSGLVGGHVLIPFMGSGSEMVAALEYGMEPTGFEVAEEYFNIASKRVQRQLKRRESENLSFNLGTANAR